MTSALFICKTLDIGAIKHRENTVSEELNRCPFCKGTNTEIRESTHWTGKRNSIISVTVIVMHWCCLVGVKSIIQIKGKTREQAIERWNMRADSKALAEKDAAIADLVELLQGVFDGHEYSKSDMLKFLAKHKGEES